MMELKALIWATREQSWSYLCSRHPSRVSVVETAFGLVDQCVDHFEELSTDSLYCRACALALLKGKNLALGNLGLILDGLAQESGALMRPMIEYMEQLKLFKQSPESAEQAMSGILQTAGVVAKAVDGMHREVREHLNENASHKSFSHHSTSHLIKPDGSFCKQQQFVPHVLDLNLQTFCVELYLLLESGANALPLPATQDRLLLGMAVDRLLSRMNHVFELGHSWDTRAS